MTCGIYKLQFGSSFYIGKSVNIEKRWEQHWDSLVKGTASKKMLEAFSRCSEPMGTILLECHPEHIDVMEGYYVITMSPDLNTSQVFCDGVDMYDKLDEDTLAYLKTSTAYILSSIENLGTIISDKDVEIDKLETELGETQENLDEMSARYYDMCAEYGAEPVGEDPRVTELQDEVNRRTMERDGLKIKVGTMETELRRLRQPWWKRWLQ